MDISYYNLFLFIFIFTGFCLIANFVKNKNKVTIFRLGILLRLLTLLSLSFLKTEIIHYIIPFAIIHGLTEALYWFSHNVLLSERISSKNMAKFAGYRNLMSSITRVLFPVVLGVFITFESYSVMAIVISVLTVIEFIVSFGIKNKSVSKNKFDMSAFKNSVKNVNFFKNVFQMEFLKGFTIAGALSTIMMMYTVYLFKTDLNLGIFSTIFAVCSILVYYFFGKFATKKMFPKLIFISSFISVASLITFLFFINDITFVIYNFFYVIGINLINLISEIDEFNVSHAKNVNNGHKTEYFLYREGLLNLGRIVSFSFLLMIGVLGDVQWLKYYLFILMVVMTVLSNRLIKINSKVTG